MCLAMPMQITQIDENRMCTVELQGASQQVSLRLLPDAKEGDFVLIHAGHAISLLDKQDALETLSLFEEMEQI